MEEKIKELEQIAATIQNLCIYLRGGNGNSQAIVADYVSCYDKLTLNLHDVMKYILINHGNEVPRKDASINLSRKLQEKRIIEVAPDMLQLTKLVYDIGLGHAPSVGVIEPLVRKASDILNEINQNG